MTGGVVAAALGAATPFIPNWAFLVPLALAPAAIWVRALDGWQRLYALVLVSMVAASGVAPGVAQSAFYLRYLSVAALIAFTWHRGRQAGPGNVTPPLVKVFLGFSVWAALSTLWSFQPSDTAQQGIALLMLGALLNVTAKYRWTGGNTFAADLRVPAVILGVAAGVSALGGLVGVTQFRVYSGRLSGIVTNPNALGLMCVLGLLLTFAAYRSSGQVRYLALVPGLAAALVMSESRTAILALLVGIAWTVLHLANGKRLVLGVYWAAWAAVLLAVLLTWTSLPAAVTDAIDRFGAQDGGSTLNARTEAWSDAWTLWQQKPWFGWGHQVVEPLLTSFGQTGDAEFGGRSAHSSYFQVLMELGVVGIVLFAVLIVMVIVTAVRARRAGFDSVVSALCVAGIVVQFAESPAFGTGQIYPYIFWLAALGLSTRRSATP